MEELDDQAQLLVSRYGAEVRASFLAIEQTNCIS